jgi:hypothetical protein
MESAQDHVQADGMSICGYFGRCFAGTQGVLWKINITSCLLLSANTTVHLLLWFLGLIRRFADWLADLCEQLLTAKIEHVSRRPNNKPISGLLTRPHLQSSPNEICQSRSRAWNLSWPPMLNHDHGDIRQRQILSHTRSSSHITSFPRVLPT